MATMRIAGVAAVLAAGMACSPVEEACTLEARSSVTVTVIDDFDAIVPNATVVFSVDGGAEQPCESIGDTWACGFEVAGTIKVKASAPGLMADSEDVVVEMEADGCHVAGEALTLLLASECDDPPPAMMITVNAPDGSAAVGESVSWGIANADMMPQPCAEDGSAGVWACGYGVTGALEIYVTPAAADPYQPYYEQINVDEGECGPNTVIKAVTLQYGED